MINNYLNFNGEGVQDLMQVSDERWELIEAKWEELIETIVNSQNDYTYKDENDAEQIGLHIGKILLLMLTSAVAPGEQLLCIANLDIFVHRVIASIKNNYLLNILNDNLPQHTKDYQS